MENYMRYDYQCNDCNNIQEESHGMREKPEVVCEKCKSKNTFKVITGGHQINMGNHPGSSQEDV